MSQENIDILKREEPDAASEENEEKDDDEEEEEEEKKKKGGACGGGSNSGKQCAEYPPGTSPEDLGEISMGKDSTDESTNSMCKKTYTIYRAIPTEEFKCPCAYRDNVSDQFTPQDDLLTMEKTVRDFMKLEGKIYDPQSTNPRFFAAEGWVQHYEKDKNVVLAALDQYKANILRMEHLYTVVDGNSYDKLLSIPNQDCRESFNTNIFWNARALKDWGNNWFIKRNAQSSTPIEEKDYWLPGLTGKMVQWMKLGNYKEFNMRDIAIETMMRKVDLLDGVIDRMMNGDSVAETISNFMNVKEVIEQNADQKKEKIFTSKIIDSQMGKKLGVTSGGKENHEKGATKYKEPVPDNVEKYKLVDKLNAVKKLFKELREKSIKAMKQCRCVSCCGAGSFSDIWTRIDDLAKPLYTDLTIMNELIEDKYEDYENPSKHCAITHAKLCPDELKKRITSFKCVIQQGVIDVTTNQAKLPKKGKNILDSMFNQLWEYGEKGPTIELPSWC